ncbi:MAG TPA: glycosyltransferase [Chitinophagales bacterium]|nr:glycosyltransferase [Chitinophagales bacterium]HRK25953.1 glycosyltransferase [Chitinophagales bacterium]
MPATNHQHILYLSYDGMTDPLGQSQVLPYLCGLSKMGYHFTLISHEKPDRYKQHKTQIEQICQNAQITWLPLAYTKKPPVLSTMYDLYRAYRLAYRLHKQKPFQLIHCRSYPAALVGSWLKAALGIGFIFDMRGFWADERADGGIWNLQNPMYALVYRYFKRKEITFLEEAAHTVSLTHRAETEIRSWKHLNQTKVQLSVIPCCVDLQLFDLQTITPEQKNSLRQQLGIANSDFVLTYAGTVGTWYMLPQMLCFFKELQSQMPHAKMLFINSNPAEHLHIQTLAAQTGITSGIIIAATTYAQMPLYLSLSTWSIFFIKPAYSKMASSPVKQGEIMAMGIPIVCNAGIGDTDHIIRQTGAGLVIETLHTQNYMQAAQVITQRQPPPAQAIQAGAYRFFALARGVKQYAAIYQSVLP